MNSLVGKSTGIALLMAAAMLAALFAMGVFSATGVGAQATAAIPSFPDTVDITVTVGEPTEKGYRYTLEQNSEGTPDEIEIAEFKATVGGAIVESETDVTTAVIYSLQPTTSESGVFPTNVETRETESNFSLDPVTGKLYYTGDGFETTTQVRVWAHRALKTAPEEADGDPTYAVSTAADADTQDSAVVEIVPFVLASAEEEAGTNQRLTINATLDAVPEGGAIKLEMKSFGGLSNIEANDVTIDGSTPSDVDVTGSTVTLYWDDGADDAEEAALDTTQIPIILRKSAGVTLPIRAGDYDIGVSTDNTTTGTTGSVLVNRVTVVRTVKVSPESGTRGTEVTVSGSGFADGTADIEIGGDVFTTATVSDGKFSVDVDTAAKDNDGNIFTGEITVDDALVDRKTEINVSDAQGNPAKDPAFFQILPSFSISPENPLSGADITITLMDIKTSTGPKVIFAGDTDDPVTAVDDRDDKDSTWKATVPGDVRIGTIQIKVTVGDDTLTQNITIGTNDLTVGPNTVVPRQTISIDGSGFTKGGEISLKKVIIDGQPIIAADATDKTELINNNGDISFDVRVPERVTSGTSKKVQVTDSGDRVGTATITIAEAEITLAPAESLRGETVTVSGTGFPANDLVLINYKDSTVDTASTSPTGTFEQGITVPASEDITPGGEYKVEAISQVNFNEVKDDAEHKVSDPEISISPDTTTAGGSITISGKNFKGFLRVHSIVIGGQDVTPVPAPSTDKWGAFTAPNIQVPQLNETRHAVKVIVGAAAGTDGSATEFLTIGAAVAEVVTDPAVIFEPLGDRLVRVWYLEPRHPGVVLLRS